MKLRYASTVSRRALLLSGAAVSAGAVPLCAWGQSADGPVRGGTLTYSVTVGEPPNYDLHANTALSVLHRLAPHYSSLVKISQINYPEVVGDLAQSWRIEEDARRYTFTLHPNVRFHDGSALTSVDIKATFERIVRPPPGVVSLRQQLYRDIASIEAPDAVTVVFNLAKPNGAMMTLLASPYNCVYAARKLAEDPRFPDRNVLGTGPFRFVRHVPGSEWIGERFDGYFRPDRPYLDGFRVINIAQPAAVNALAAGQIHTDFRGLNLQERNRVAEARGAAARIAEADQPAYMALTVNTDRAPLNDVRVRQALNIAIDRWRGAEGLARTFAYNRVGGMLRSGTPFARTREQLQALPGFRPDIEANRAEARRLLAAAGQPNLRLKLVSRREYLPLCVYVVDQWRQVGVTATLDLLETADYFSTLQLGTFETAADGVIDYVDEPTLQFQSMQSFDRNPNNRTRAIDRTADDLYERQMRATDPGERRAVVAALEAHLMDRAYRVPLFWGVRYMAAAAELRGYDLANPSNLIGQDLADVWLARS